MVAHVATVAFLGLEARGVEVQVHIASGLPKFIVVGLSNTALSFAVFMAATAWLPAFAGRAAAAQAISYGAGILWSFMLNGAWVFNDHGGQRTQVVERKLVAVSAMVAAFSGKAVVDNAPIVGRDTFTQTAGIHADGDAKGGLYASRLAPARFGRRRRYALGKLSGKASLDQNLAALGIELAPEARALVLARIVELGDRKHSVTPEDLPHLIADVLKTPDAQQLRIEPLHPVQVDLGQLH